MKRVALACAAVAAAIICGAAGPSGLQAAFRNTVVSTYPDGRQAKLWLAKDGSYTAEGRRHDRSNGHWKLKDGRICLRQSHPPTLPFSYCTDLPSGGVGATWSAKAVTGEAIRVRLVKGGR